MSGPVVVVAPAPWKGSHGAAAVAGAVAAGVRAALPGAIIHEVPLADGGEGTAAALAAAYGGRFESARVRDPRGRPIEARWLRLPGGGVAIVDAAAACGLPLLAPGERDPEAVDTAGVGDLLLAIAASGAREVWLGIGGTATVDGGRGALQALGIEVDPPSQSARENVADPLPSDPLRPRGSPPLRLSAFPPDPQNPRVRLLLDVDAPLLGPTGAASAFGPQKGATPAQVARLEAALERWAESLAQAFGRDPRTGPPGMGAGGGLASGLWSALGASVESGAEAVARATGLRARIAAADLVITGEGRLDATTAQGKAPALVSRIAAACGVPCMAVVGRRAPGADAPTGVTVVEAALGAEDATLADISTAAGRLAAAIRMRR